MVHGISGDNMPRFQLPRRRAASPHKDSPPAGKHLLLRLAVLLCAVFFVPAGACASGNATAGSNISRMATNGTTGTPLHWISVAQGLELAESSAVFRDTSGTVALLRIDPRHYSLQLYTISEQGGPPQTPSEWAALYNLDAVINASMFLPDGSTSTGYMRNGTAANNSRINQRFGSFLVFSPLPPHAAASDGQPPAGGTQPDPYAPAAAHTTAARNTPNDAGSDNQQLPAADVLDRYADDWQTLLPRYRGVVQNFRMISADRKPLWPEEGDSFSIAAIGKDTQGRILFIHSRAQTTVRELSEYLLDICPSLGATMYVEGGAQAALHLSTPALTRSWVGRAGSSFWYSATGQWPLPNIIGIRKRSAQLRPAATSRSR
jgi:hypothetical protein